MSIRVPLAWKNLTHDRRRLLAALAGVGFAVLLMCMQLGFRNALFDSTVALLEQLNADLILVSTARYSLSMHETFSRRRLYQALACPGVVAAEPVYIELQLAQWKSPEDGIGRPVRVLGFDPRSSAFRLKEINDQARALEHDHAVLLDAKSKRDLGRGEVPFATELSGRRVRVVGTFELGTDFVNDGNLVTSSGTFGRLFRSRGAGPDGLAEVDLGLVRVAAHADPAAVQRELAARLPGDIDVFTLRQFIDLERGFWASSTPIGYVFGVGALMGFVVGVIVCYQVLYSDISQHMPEFATLKAIGYPGRYFFGVVLQQALWLALLGFVPGALISLGLYGVVAAAQHGQAAFLHAAQRADQRQQRGFPRPGRAGHDHDLAGEQVQIVLGQHLFAQVPLAESERQAARLDHGLARSVKAFTARAGRSQDRRLRSAVGVAMVGS